MKEILIGVLGVVAGSVATAFLQWPVRLWNYLRRRVPPDHSSLYGSSWALTTTTSSDSRIRVQGACAPDRSLNHSSLNPDSAIAFVHAQFSGEFSSNPAFSMPGHGVRFDRDGIDLADGYTWVWANGRLDYDHYVQPRVEDGRVLVPVLDILRVIAKLASAAASPDYSQVFGRSRFRARHFDWFIGVSPGIVQSDGFTVQWSDLEFPGSRPQRAGVNPQPFCPSVGYAKEALTSWNPKKPMTDFLKAFLVDFLYQNGYYNCDLAISDSLAAFVIDN